MSASALMRRMLGYQKRRSKDGVFEQLRLPWDSLFPAAILGPQRDVYPGTNTGRWLRGTYYKGLVRG